MGIFGGKKSVQDKAQATKAAKKQEVVKDPALDCPECGGEGLKDQFALCPHCRGTGRR